MGEGPPDRASEAWDDPGAEAPLLPRVARADRGAIDRCIKQYGPLVWFMARQMSLTAQDAEDAVQEIFLDLWKHAGRFDPAVGPEKVFVTIVARRRLIDRVRRTQRRLAAERRIEQEQASEEVSGPDDAAERGSEIVEARRILKQLPPPHQQVIALSLLEGFSHAEIAARTGWPLGTVKTVLRRGILRLQSLAGRPAPGKTAENLE